MILNRKSIYAYVLTAIIIAYVQYEPSKDSNYELPSKSILTLDEKVFKAKEKKQIVDEDTNRFWGYKDETVADETLEDTSTSNEQIKVTQPDGKNLLCIGESCYRLLGIHYNYKTPMVTLFNSSLKEKVKNYKQKEILESRIRIKKIYLNRVEFTDLLSEDKWEFNLFDVNQTKYKPKEIEE